MIADANVGGKWSGKKMKGEDGLRTMECLRGRLLAEREASRVAKQDADQMTNKLTELETQLTEEIKSRNRAEKRLTSLIKKLESMNLLYVSEDSSLLEKSDDISSVSSTASSITKKPEDRKEPKTQFTIISKCSQDLDDNFSQSNSSEKANSQGSIEIDHRSSRSSMEKEGSSEVNSDHQAKEDHVDNSLALVKVDLPKESLPTNPLIVSTNVKEVLDALRHAREKLQLSMERRNMIKVGYK